VTIHQTNTVPQKLKLYVPEQTFSGCQKASNLITSQTYGQQLHQ